MHNRWLEQLVLLAAAAMVSCGAIDTNPVSRQGTHQNGAPLPLGGASGADTGENGGGPGGAGTSNDTASGGRTTSPAGGGSGGSSVEGDGAAAAAAPGDGCGKSTPRIFLGTFDDPTWLAHWDGGASLNFGKENLELVQDARFATVLRVHYPRGSIDPALDPVGGAQFRAHVKGLPRTSVCFSYWLRFDPQFQFVKGGKLPGLCGGDCPSGGDQTNGQSGWSVRYMWRAYGAGEAYGYILPPEEYGTELGLGTWTFGLGKWHHIEEQIVLNDPGKSNGVARVWYDRAQTGERPDYEATNLVYRSVSTLAIDRIFFSTFFGGHDATWATPLATYVDFAQFELFE
jgi:hypothetical protein